jgi:DNA polymerase III subunit epsilon
MGRRGAGVGAWPGVRLSAGLGDLVRRPPDPRRYPAGPVRALAAAPPQSRRTPVSQVGFLAVDIETTGLDPAADHVLALGWVPVSAGELLLDGAGERMVRPPDGAEVGESATVHGLTDDELASAQDLEDVLPALLEALQGRVLVAHYAPIELKFLARAVQASYGVRAPLTAVDTMDLQQRLVTGLHGEVPPGLLSLDDARHSFGLPRYAAHRALTDAMAAGELFLAQAAELEHRLGREPTLGDLRPVRRR